DLQQDGKLIPLKQKNIDTGMGLERLCMVVNNLNSVFDTDLFLPIKQQLLNYLNPDITNSTRLINYINAISDHVRAATFAISEGVIPTTEGRGYVIRKIIRRAVRYLKLLNHNEPLLYKLVPKVVNLMKDYYPELELHREKVAVIVKSEEEKFLETLDEGLKLIDEIIKTGKTKIDGSVVFKLYDTYGFPKELVDEILKENKITYNDLEFYEAEAKAKEIAKQSWHGVKVVDTSVYLSFPKTNFVGYQQLVSSSVILGMIKNGQKINTATKGDTVEVLFDTTPFYGESGGQIGDTGFVKLKDKNKLVGKIKDTKKFEERIVHIVELIDDIKQTDEVLLEVDISRRKDIMRHHTATHLLHKALRETLGEHAIQSGSLVSDEYFRFDFVHWQALTEEEIYRIEKIVNQKIFECLPVSIIYTNINTAKKLGAVALFEEKYAQEVRMVVIGGKIENDQIIQQPYSIELCGGTHCSNTAEIGIFKILSESSVGANIRRIEAICGQKVYEYITNLKHTLHSV
ncbi:MAG: alanine--tRNA ligase, partial [Endomicrobia bacterium]|nr:alanine--tRNA ligase [Endomicrobiia bacterium]